jgi:hypothetical protein
MAVGENVSVDLGNFRAESSVSSSSNDQDHHIHNNNVLIQPLYMKVSQVGHHQAPPYNHHHQQRSNGGESYKREIRELQELFSKLNPMAAEFVPPSLSNNNSFGTVCRTLPRARRRGDPSFVAGIDCWGLSVVKKGVAT